jgi:hypothetical protein
MLLMNKDADFADCRWNGLGTGPDFFDFFPLPSLISKNQTFIAMNKVLVLFLFA